MVKKKIVVYAFQCADLFHKGHLRALMQAKALGDYLIVGILTDKAMMAYKRKPIISYRDRAEIVEHIDVVDEVVKQKDVDPTENLKRLMPDILVHGDDWDENFPGADYMRSIGGKVILTKYYPYESTTSIINRLKGCK